MKNWMLCAIALVVVCVPRVSAGADAPPTFAIRVRSIDTLVDNAKLLVTLAGREEIAKQVEGLIKAKIGAKGLEGIDPTRPLGAYGRFGKEIDDISGAVLIPIADEKAFLGLLDNVGLNVTKGKDEIYTVQTGSPIEVYFRFANRYAYVTALNTLALEKEKMVDPAKVLGVEGPAFAATLHIDQLPEGARQIALAQIELSVQDALERKAAGASEPEKAMRAAFTKEVTKALASIIKDGSEVNLTLDLNAKSKELAASFSLKGKPGSELATTLQAIGQRTSQFGSLRDSQSAFHGAINFALPDELKKVFVSTLEQAAQAGVDRLQDAAKRQQAEKLMEALRPTIKSGEVDGFVQLIGPTGKHYAILAGIKLHDGTKLGATIHDLIAEVLPQVPEPFRSRIKLNHATEGGTKIHQFELPDEDEKIRQLGELTGDLHLNVAFTQDAVWLAIGKESMNALKKALAGKTTGLGPILLIDIDVARLGAVLAPTDELRASVKTIFQAPEDGQVRVAVAGGAALRFSVTMRLPVLQFLSQMREAKGEN